MSTETLEQEVRALLEAALGESLDGIPDPSARQYERWDSLAHLEIVFLLEERFDVRLSEEEIPELASLGGILAVLGRKNAG